MAGEDMGLNDNAVSSLVCHGGVSPQRLFEALFALNRSGTRI